MLFESLKQIYIFLGAIYFGLLCGIVRDFCLFIFNLTKKNKIVSFILDLVFSIIGTFLFIICLNVVNFGEFRIYLLLSYLLGYLIERKSLGFLVDFIFKKVYNLLTKVFKKLGSTKFVKRLLVYDRKTSKNINKNR